MNDNASGISASVTTPRSVELSNYAVFRNERGIGWMCDRCRAVGVPIPDADLTLADLVESAETHEQMMCSYRIRAELRGSRG